ncbi:MAG: hypothetical protein OEX08_01610 [Candidatus Nomurabacteria bacterium]|nr:hypothetical protein [Candidatus Nomurabacteria bacterium]
MKQQKEKIIKDTQKTMEQSIALYKDKLLQNNVYIKDKDFFELTKRGEKIVLACYLVADVVTDKKYSDRLQLVADRLFDCVYNISGGDIVENDTWVFVIESLLSIVSIGVTTGRVSDMNGQILDRELREILRSGVAILDKQNSHFQAKETNQPDIPMSLFTPSNVAFSRTKTDISVKDIYKGHLKDTKPVKDILDKTAIKDTPKTPTKLFEKQNQSARRLQILELFYNKKELNINEIDDAMAGTSKKTIQRELTKMIEENVLYKKGDRRWSTYILVDSADTGYKGHLG